MPRQDTRIIAIAFSDHHYCNWKQFNKDDYRIKVADKILNEIIKKANKLEVPILFCGDLVDHPKHLDNVLLQRISKTLTKIKTQLIGINGNHDQPRANTFSNPVPGYLNHFDNLVKRVNCVDNTNWVVEEQGIMVHGIPYIFGNIDFLEALEERVKDTKKSKKLKHILLLHRDMEGALEPSGKRIDKDKKEDTQIIKGMLANFDLVICGHIHKPQQLKKFGNHVYMLGATHQQRRSDANCTMGYWVIYDNLRMEFIPSNAPEFKFYTDEPGNDTDFWIKLPTEVVEKVKEGTDEFSLETQTREKLVKRYLVAKGQKSKRKLKLATKYL